jgi:hypothetical protein
VVFASLMMLAFLIDQVQQVCNPLFQEAWRNTLSSKIMRPFGDMEHCRQS